MPSNKLPAIKQDYYNENRERFEAETTILDRETLSKSCPHYYITEGLDVRCKTCHAGWPSLAKYFVIENGKVEKALVNPDMVLV